MRAIIGAACAANDEALSVNPERHLPTRVLVVPVHAVFAAGVHHVAGKLVAIDLDGLLRQHDSVLVGEQLFLKPRALLPGTLHLVAGRVHHLGKLRPIPRHGPLDISIGLDLVDPFVHPVGDLNIGAEAGVRFNAI